jgi:hypothetical protein
MRAKAREPSQPNRSALHWCFFIADDSVARATCGRAGLRAMAGRVTDRPPGIPGTQRYIVTSYDLKVAFFYSKVHLRLLRPGWAALANNDTADGSRPITSILNKLDAEVDRLCNDAQLRAAA